MFDLTTEQTFGMVYIEHAFVCHTRQIACRPGRKTSRR